MKVSVGPSSIAGWLTFAGAELAYLSQAIAGAHLHVPNTLLLVLGVAALVATNAGRQLQAALAPHVEPYPPPPPAATQEQP